MSTATSSLPVLSAVPRPRRATLAGCAGGELIKLGRLRAARALVVLWLIACVPTIAAVVGNVSASARRTGGAFDAVLSVLEAVFLGGAFPFLLVLSGALVAMEYGHGTVRVLLARGAGRTRLLLSKLLALEAVGLALVCMYAAMCATECGLAALVWRVSPAAVLTAPWTDLVLAFLTSVCAMTVAIVVGAAAGVLGRSVAAAFLIGFGFFAVDSLLLPLVTRGLTAGVSLGFQLGKLIAALRLPALAHGPRDAVQPAIVVGAWLVLLLVLSRQLLVRRDVLE